MGLVTSFVMKSDAVITDVYLVHEWLTNAINIRFIDDPLKAWMYELNANLAKLKTIKCIHISDHCSAQLDGLQNFFDFDQR